jgi:hypothetical protein
MKRIGILTYHCIPNFGAQLQALSTIGYLRDNGYEPVMLNWYPSDLEEEYRKRAPEDQNRIQFNFSQKNMPVSRLCRTLEELCEEIEDLQLDAVIAGSDALFDYTPEKHRYNFSLRRLKKIPIKITSNHLLPNPFWGSFNDVLSQKIPVYGYAISSQNMPYQSLSKEECKELRRLLNGFEKITVRDNWTADLVKKVGDIEEAPVVPDPVFALNQNYRDIPSKEEIIKRFRLPDNYILISFLYPILDDEYVNEIIRLAEYETGAKCVSFPMPDKLRRFNTKYTVELPLSPTDWYSLIKYSQGYIGERMHPIVVCMHNAIPFFCFDQYGTTQTIIPRLWSRFVPKSSKIFHILKEAGLGANSVFYKNAKEITPRMVVDRFVRFDRDKCYLFSKAQLESYNKSMKMLLNHVR